MQNLDPLLEPLLVCMYIAWGFLQLARNQDTTHPILRTRVPKKVPPREAVVTQVSLTGIIEWRPFEISQQARQIHSHMYVDFECAISPAIASEVGRSALGMTPWVGIGYSLCLFMFEHC